MPKLIEDLFIPKGIEDRALLTALRSYVPTAIISTLMNLPFIFLSFHVGAQVFGRIQILWGFINIFALILLKMGFHRASRYIYFVNSCLLLLIGCQMIGYESIQWIYFLTFPSWLCFYDHTQRKIFFVFFLTSPVSFAFFITVVLYVLHAVTPEYLPQYKYIIEYTGLYTGCKRRFCFTDVSD